MLYYLPPVNGNYIPPWLWYDGDPDGSWSYWDWESKIVDRMNQPSPVTIQMWGSYYPADDTGTVYARFRNDSTATIDGRVLFVITEDSLYYQTPYIEWHNNVPRDYLPDENGAIVSIPPGDSVTVSQPFTIDIDWNADFCRILTWIQNDSMQVDSTKEIWQGGLVKVTDLISGIEDEFVEELPRSGITVTPNPCVEATEFSFHLPAESAYRIGIFDIMGRRIRTLNGVTSGGRHSIRWNRRDDAGTLVRAGVYLYHFTSDIITVTGKVIVR
jgi:hypothetical protein